jgi:6-phosphogluconate dehydrogenase
LYTVTIWNRDRRLNSLASLAGCAPGIDTAARTQGAVARAEQGFLHCAPHAAGHFAKMVHEGAEFGLNSRADEGLDVLKHANVGKREHAKAGRHRSPLRLYRYQMNLPEIAEAMRHEFGRHLEKRAEDGR